MKFRPWMGPLTWVLLLLLASVPWAESVRERLAQTVRARYGNRMPYATLVAYKKMYFATAYDVDAETRNSTGRRTHFAVYEYVNQNWQFIFEFEAGVDADEESARLDALFARHRFSSQMRGKLMYGEEFRL